MKPLKEQNPGTIEGTLKHDVIHDGKKGGPVKDHNFRIYEVAEDVYFQVVNNLKITMEELENILVQHAAQVGDAVTNDLGKYKVDVPHGNYILWFEGDSNMHDPPRQNYFLPSWAAAKVPGGGGAWLNRTLEENPNRVAPEDEVPEQWDWRDQVKDFQFPDLDADPIFEKLDDFQKELYASRWEDEAEGRDPGKYVGSGGFYWEYKVPCGLKILTKLRNENLGEHRRSIKNAEREKKRVAMRRGWPLDEGDLQNRYEAFMRGSAYYLSGEDDEPRPIDLGAKESQLKPGGDIAKIAALIANSLAPNRERFKKLVANIPTEKEIIAKYKLEELGENPSEEQCKEHKQKLADEGVYEQEQPELDDRLAALRPGPGEEIVMLDPDANPERFGSLMFEGKWTRPPVDFRYDTDRDINWLGWGCDTDGNNCSYEPEGGLDEIAKNWLGLKSFQEYIDKNRSEFSKKLNKVRGKEAGIFQGTSRQASADLPIQFTLFLRDFYKKIKSDDYELVMFSSDDRTAKAWKSEAAGKFDFPPVTAEVKNLAQRRWGMIHAAKDIVASPPPSVKFKKGVGIPNKNFIRYAKEMDKRVQEAFDLTDVVNKIVFVEGGSQGRTVGKTETKVAQGQAPEVQIKPAAGAPMTIQTLSFAERRACASAQAWTLERVTENGILSLTASEPLNILSDEAYNNEWGGDRGPCNDGVVFYLLPKGWRNGKMLTSNEEELFKRLGVNLTSGLQTDSRGETWWIGKLSAAMAAMEKSSAAGAVVPAATDPSVQGKTTGMGGVVAPVKGKVTPIVPEKIQMSGYILPESLSLIMKLIQDELDK